MPKNNKKRFNVIDFAVLLLLFAAIAATIYFFTHKNGVFTKYKYDVEYEITVENIRAEFVDNIAVGDTVCDMSTAFPLGTVVKVTSESVDEDISKMTVTVEAKAEEHGGVLSINGVSIASGSAVWFRVPNLASYGECTSVTIR